MRRIDAQLLAALAFTLTCSTHGLAAVATIVPATDSQRRLVEKGLNHRVWETLKSQVLPSGRVITSKESVYELASGMYNRDANGELIESQELIELAQGGGAVARRGQHQVFFSPNANTAGAIDLQIGGKRLRSHLLALAFADSTTGKSVVIATIKDSIGELVGNNQIIYRDAFSDLKADVLYTYTKSGFSQDIVLRERPPTPESLGLVSETTVMEALTEFLDAPLPTKTTKRLTLSRTAAGVPSRQVVDQTLSFGPIVMPTGRAFSLGENRDQSKITSALPVGKTWEVIDGRTILVESLPYTPAKARLNALPQPAAIQNAGPQPLQTAFFSKEALLKNLPRRALAKASPRNSDRIRLASRPLRSKGYVIDYEAVVVDTDIPDIRFESDKTYIISGTVNVAGTTTFEGGTVVKFATTNSAVLNMYSAVECLTDPYRPAIFTSQNDNTVGASTWASGTPTNFFQALATGDTGAQLRYIRVSYADYAVHAYEIDLAHSQIVHCGAAVSTDWGPCAINNVLMYDVGTAFAGSTYTASATDLTLNQCGLLADDFDDPALSSIAFTNCLITAVATNGSVSVTTNHSYILASATGVFQTAGAAAHYLATNSPYRAAGTTNIPSWLAADLQRMTTYPPVVLQSVGYTNSNTLSPQAQRDYSGQDIGYHYVPLDYAVGASAVFTTNGTLTIAPGTAIGTFQLPSYNYSFYLYDGGKIVCEGSPTRMNHIARYNMVQEQANTNWGTSFGYALIPYCSVQDELPQARFRFTEWSTPARDTYHLFGYDGGYHIPLSFLDNQFHGGLFHSFHPTLGVTNSLFDRVDLVLSDGNGPFDATFQNNLFYGGTNFIEHYDVGTWVYRDNLFHGTGISFDFDPVDADYNAYLTNALTLASSRGSHEIVLTNASINFESGPLGNYYLPANLSRLINQGSTTADQVGLYHFTTQVSQTTETNSVVDAGFHYVAVDGSGVPLDSDGDGIRDYIEDINGNGTADSGEIDWQSYTSDNGLSASGSKLQVFTPLK